jgi:hypothetical protein
MQEFLNEVILKFDLTSWKLLSEVCYCLKFVIYLRFVIYLIFKICNLFDI